MVPVSLRRIALRLKGRNVEPGRDFGQLKQPGGDMPAQYVDVLLSHFLQVLSHDVLRLNHVLRHADKQGVLRTQGKGRMKPFF